MDQPPPYQANADTKQNMYPQQGNAPYPPQQGAAYPQQAGGLPQQTGGYQQTGQTTVVLTQPVFPGIQMFREAPVRVKCQFCQADVVTATTYEVGTLGWIACFIIFWILPFGCCLLPFCIDGCKDVVHSCPNCHQTVGRYNRM